MKQAKLLTQAEQKRIAAVINAHRYSARNHAIFAVSFFAGLRACEIAGLKVGDVFDMNGEVRDTVYLAAGQTKGDEANTVLVSKRLSKALSPTLSPILVTSAIPTQHFFLAQSAVGLVRRPL